MRPELHDGAPTAAPVPGPCLPNTPHPAPAHLLCLETALDPLVLDAGDGVQEAAAGELQALVDPAVGQPLPVAHGSPQPGQVGTSLPAAGPASGGTAPKLITHLLN